MIVLQMTVGKHKMRRNQDVVEEVEPYYERISLAGVEQSESSKLLYSSCLLPTHWRFGRG